MQVTFTQKVNSTYPKYQATPQKNVVKPKQSSQTQKALSTAAGWFAFGVGLDYCGRKLTVFKSPTKNSIFINSILATGAGLVTLFSKPKS